jgi:hypothetical protein
MKRLVAAVRAGALTAGLLGGLFGGLLSACGGSDDAASLQSGPTRATTPTDVLDSYTSVVEFDDIYGFSGPTLAGDRIDGANFANRILAIWFWAPW